MTEKIEPDTTHEEGHEEEPPHGTLLVTVLFLLMCVFMFSWAYYILLLRV